MQISPFFTTAVNPISAPAVFDPHRASVILHLQGNGPTGAEIVDTSPSPKTLSIVGNTFRSTQSAKFGVGSILFDGFGDYIRITAANMNSNLLAGDFTIDWWQNLADLSSIRTIGLSQFRQTTGVPGLVVNANANGSVTFNFGLAQSPTTITSSAGAVSPGVWQHIAVSRGGTTLRLFINGTLSGTASNATGYAAQTFDYVVGSYFTNTLTLPATGVPAFSGYIDELRVTRALRWTASFTPPVGPGA